MPPTTQLSGTFFDTTAPAAITTLFPILTPGNIVTFPPIHTSLPMLTGLQIPIRSRRYDQAFWVELLSETGTKKNLEERVKRLGWASDDPE